MKPTQEWVNLVTNIPPLLLRILCMPLMVIILPLGILGFIEWLFTLGHSMRCLDTVAWIFEKEYGAYADDKN